MQRDSNLFNQRALQTAVLVLRAADHKLRHRICLYIGDAKTAKFEDISTKLAFDQSATSQHLAILHKAGMVIRKQDGAHIHYRLNKQRIKTINEAIQLLSGGETDIIFR